MSILYHVLIDEILTEPTVGARKITPEGKVEIIKRRVIHPQR